MGTLKMSYITVTIYVTNTISDTPLSAKVGTSFADRWRPLCRPKPCRAV